MTYKAIVTKLSNVRSVPELNSLKIATVNGDQILVGKSCKEGDIGVYFPGGGVISEKHLTECNLYVNRFFLVQDPGKTDLKVGQEITTQEYRDIKDDLEKNLKYKSLVGCSVSSHPKEKKKYVVDESGDTDFKIGDIITVNQLKKSNSDIKKRNSKIAKEALGYLVPKGKTINKGGSFERSGRVRTVRFQGIESNGFWQPLESDGKFNFKWTGQTIDWFQEGQQFDVINTHKVCEKYFTKAELNAIKERNKVNSVNTGFKVGLNLKQHYDTPQLTHVNIPENSILVITEKLHGTSGRTGYVPEPLNLNWFQHKWNDIANKFNLGLCFATHDFQYISGSRRVVLKDPSVDQGYYQGTTFRGEIHNKIKSSGLHPNETLYYEIVGYTHPGSLIMPKHTVKDDKLKKRFGSEMAYTYGCADGEYEIYVYRITIGNHELSWDAVKRRCHELNLKHVPELKRMIHDGDNESLVQICIQEGTKVSTLDDKHLMEGVCVRFTNDLQDKNVKFKNFFFRQQEDIRKEDEYFVDPEDIA